MSVNKTVARTRSATGLGGDPGEELFHLVEELVGFAGEGDVFVARQLEEFRSRNPVRDVVAVLGADVTIPPTANDQRRGLDGGQHIGDVALEHRPRRGGEDVRGQR